jgi:hypothetical protein
LDQGEINMRVFISVVAAVFLIAALKSEAMWMPPAAQLPGVKSRPVVQPPNVLGKQDLPFIHAEYEANQARWFKEFKGRPFEATLTIDSVREDVFFHNIFIVSFMEVRATFSPASLVTKCLPRIFCRKETQEIRSACEEQSTITCSGL